QILKWPIGIPRLAKARKLAHRPEPAAVHGGIDSAGIRELTGSSEIGMGVPPLEVVRSIEARDLQAGQGGKPRLALVHPQTPLGVRLEGIACPSRLTVRIEPPAGLSPQPASLHVFAQERAGAKLRIAQVLVQHLADREDGIEPD